MDPGPLRDILTVVVGGLTGMLSALFGVGGATISTPGIRALGASATVAIGTTLPSIIPGALTGTISYARAGLIDWRTVAATAPPGVAAAVAGSWLSTVVPGEGHVLMLMTAALLGVSAYRMGRSSKPVEPDGKPLDDVEDDREPAVVAESTPTAASGSTTTLARAHEPYPIAALAIVGVASGVLSGLLGLGGGIILVPVFSQVVGMKVKQAVATSLACVAIFAVPSTLSHAVIGDIDWRFALLLAVGVIPGARLGSLIAMRISERRLARVVAIFLGATSVIYGISETVALFH